MINEDQNSAPGISIIHRQTVQYDSLGDDTYIPISHRQFREVLGRVLTHLDALGLPDRAHRASKSLLQNDMWRWWNEVYDNATTSHLGCIAPIVMANGTGVIDDAVEPSNRWGWASEEAYLAGRPSKMPPA